MFGKYFDHDGCYFKYSKQYKESWFIELFLFLDAMSIENMLEASLVWTSNTFLFRVRMAFSLFQKWGLFRTRLFSALNIVKNKAWQFWKYNPISKKSDLRQERVNQTFSSFYSSTFFSCFNRWFGRCNNNFKDVNL